MKPSRTHKAVASQLGEFSEAIVIHGEFSGNRDIIRDCLRSVALGKVTPKVRELLRILATRTVAEINKEREAFRALLGSVRTGKSSRDLRCRETHRPSLQKVWK